MKHMTGAKHALYTVVAQGWWRWTLLAALTIGLATAGMAYAGRQNPSAAASGGSTSTLQTIPDTSANNPATTNTQGSAQRDNNGSQSGEGTVPSAPSSNYSYNWHSSSNSSTYNYDNGSGTPVSGGSGSASSSSNSSDGSGDHGSSKQWTYQPSTDSWQQTLSRSW